MTENTALRTASHDEARARIRASLRLVKAIDEGALPVEAVLLGVESLLVVALDFLDGK